MRLRCCTLAATVLVLANARSAIAQEIPRRLDRDTVIALALDRNPTIRATHERANAAERRADAEGKLPSPELEVQVWQLPFSSTQGMVMAGVRQSFPALGLALSPRASAVRAEARAIDVESGSVARDVRRRAAHAFADYFEASERVRLHATHVELDQKILEATQARTEAGRPLSDVTQAEVELAMVTVEHHEAKLKRDGARAEINALLLQPIDAALPEPVAATPMAPAWSLARIVEEAERRRPEIALAAASAEAGDARSSAAKAEWLAPTLSVAALYFAPVGPTTTSGGGFSVSLDLPWLWGERKARFDAAKLDASASHHRVDGMRVDVAAEVGTAWRDAVAAALRVRSYDELVLPASHKALDAAFAGYATARTDLPALLFASRSVIESEVARLVAATGLEHALAELDAAAGFAVPRVPLADWRMP